MQSVTRTERYLRAIEECGLCENLSRKLRILAGAADGLSKRLAMDGWDGSFSAVASSLERIGEACRGD